MSTAISTIAIEECFSSPQRPEIRSERVNVKVKAHGTTQTIAELKKAIIRKGYPSLSDPARITLILPTGKGLVLQDHMLASSLPHNPKVLALVSPSANEASRLQATDGIHFPSIVYVYNASCLRTYLKMPHSIPSRFAGVWTCISLAWSMDLDELVSHFSQLGFDPSLVLKEARRFNQHLTLSSGPFASVNPAQKGYIAPHLMFRLWDAAGLNKLAASQRALRAQAFAEFDVYSASCFSVDSVSSVATVREAGRGSCSPPLPIPSVVMASPSEHESAYDESFYQHILHQPASAPTVSGSSDDCHSLACSELERMDWALDPTSHARGPFATSSRVSKLIRKVNELTRDRDQAYEECARLRESQSSGDETAAAALAMLGAQANSYEAERMRLGVQLESLTQANLTLKEEVQAEVKQVEALFDKIGQLQAGVGAEAGVRETVNEIRENLASVVTCSICCERYGSLSENMTRRPIHLSCGHIFCASCLDADWSTRSARGLQDYARCFNRCSNFDATRLGEIYLLEDVKQALDRMAEC